MNRHRQDKFDKEALNLFCCDKRLKSLEKLIGRETCFDILKVTRRELQHSNVLAWLLNPNGSHGVGYMFVQLFFKELKKIGLITKNPSELKLKSLAVTREKFSHIDILLESKLNRLVVAIENKIDAKESPTQLSDYAQVLKKNFLEYDKVMLFLSPDGREPSDAGVKCGWKALGYEVIIKILDECEKIIRKKRIKTHAFLTQYLELIKREFMDNNESVTLLCKQIYRDHKDALDLIYEKRDDVQFRVYDAIKKWFEKKKYKRIFFSSEIHSVKNYIHFTSKVLDNYFPQRPNKIIMWKSNRLAYYEVFCRQNVWYAKLLVFPKEIRKAGRQEEKIGRTLLGLTSKDFDSENVSKTVKSFTDIKYEYNEEEDYMGSGKLEKKIDDFMNRLDAKIKEYEISLKKKEKGL